MTVIGALLIFTISGVGGLAMILEALYRLFEEGKISRALYQQILEALARKFGRNSIPIEHLLDA
jgi:recombinational DNA repair protein (RecF pathway)